MTTNESAKNEAPLSDLQSGSRKRILVVDDEELIRISLRKLLERQGFSVTTAGTALETLRHFETDKPEIVILDIRLPDSDGLHLLKTLKEANPSVVVIMITACPDIQNSVEAMKMGAFDFLEKPIDMSKLLAILNQMKNERAKQKLPSGDSFVFGSRAMEEVYRITERLADKDDVSLLVLGESGTGKSFLCRTLHELSSRKKHPFIEIGCSTIPEHLIESELFGYEKGAFTDAKTGKKGLVEMADGGTLFLDEIGDMPYAMQSKLLSLIEERKFRKVGGVRQIRVDVRIVAATHRNLHDLVQQGRFRLDLYYRLNVVTIEMPPLRKRAEDIPLLIMYYLGHFSAKHNCQARSMTEPATEVLKNYSWPGNVRELKNLVEKLVIMAKGEKIGLDEIPSQILSNNVTVGDTFMLPLPAQPAGNVRPPEQRLESGSSRTNLSLKALEEESIKTALRMANGNQREAAKLLDITRDTLRYRMKKLGLGPGQQPLP